MSGRVCRWAEDVDGVFETACGRAFVLTGGTLKENEMRFCCYCGYALVEVKYAESEEAT